METKKVRNFVWSAINPTDNKLFKGYSEPTIEQQHWDRYSLNNTDFRNYTLDFWELTDLQRWDSENPNFFPFRILWTDNDDSMRHLFVKTEKDAREIMAFIEGANCWNEMMEMLEMLNFNYW